LAFDKTAIIQNAQKFTIKGQIDKAIEEWQKIVKESPNDGNTFNTIGDLYLKKNNNQEAIASYLKAAKAFDSAGFSLKTIAVYKKIIKIDPENIEIQIKMADLDAERGLVGNAIEEYLKVVRYYSKLALHKEATLIYKKIVGLDPNNVQMRLMLASLCEKGGEKREPADQYIQIAKIYRTQGKILEGEDALRRALTLEPGDSQAVELLKEFQSADHSVPDPGISNPSESQFGNSGGAVLSEAVSFQEFSMNDEPSVVRKEPIRPLPPAQPAAPIQAGLENVNKEQTAEKIEKPSLNISRLLVEAEAYLKVNLFPPAVENIKKILEIDPANLEAQHLLLTMNALKQENQVDVPSSAPSEAISDSFSGGSEESDLKVDFSAFDASLAPPPEEPSETTEAPAPSFSELDDEKAKEKMAEGEFYTQQGLLTEAKIIYETILKYSPGNVLARTKLTEISNSLNETSAPESSGFEQVFSEPAPLPPEEPFIPGQESVVEPVSPQPAPSPEQKIFTPGTVRLKTTVLDKTEKTDFVNLMGELEGEFREEVVAPSDEEVQDDDFGKIIKEFQKGIQANIGEKDFETHFDLGVAYKEMGLRTEAIGEFQISIKGGPRTVDSAILLAQCYLEDGLPKLAIEQLTHAIEMKQLNQDQMHSLKYELANLYEIQENHEDALNVLSDIYKENVNYRDVSKKISQIRQHTPRKA
jgi:tetratricopeptide (TPR) repeat protein